MYKKSLVVLLMIAMIFSMLPSVSHANLGTVRVIIENETFKEDPDFWSGRILDTRVSLTNTMTMMDAIVEAANAGGITIEGAENNYISYINDLGEFDGGQESGWMGTLNDWFTHGGFKDFSVAKGDLKDGDEIRVMYTKNLGNDIGGSWSNNDKRLKSISFSAGQLSPSFNRETYDYTLEVPEDVPSIKVTPTAMNKNFQVRSSISGQVYRRQEYLPVENGTEILVKIGDPSWPSMNNQYGNTDASKAKEYRFTIKKPVQDQPKAPEIKKALSPLKQEVNVGDRIQSLSLSATGTDLSYSWFMSKDGGSFQPISGATSSFYTPSGLDAGSYEFYVEVFEKSDRSLKATSQKVKVLVLKEDEAKEPEDPKEEVPVKRLFGSTRYHTALEVAKAQGLKPRRVFLASGENFPDALSVMPLVKKEGGILLLTRKNSLDEEILSTMKTFSTKEVTLLGGSLAISKEVEDTLKKEGFTTKRLEGETRYKTAVKAAEALSNKDVVFLVSGTNFADAVSIAPVSISKGVPILLANKTSIPKETLDALKTFRTKEVIIIGGSSAVFSGAEELLKKEGITTRRIHGATRYETNQNIIKEFFTTTKHVYVASGEHFADALTGSLLVEKEGGVLLLSPKSSLHPGIKPYGKSAEMVTLFGGPLALSDEVMKDLQRP